jgi:hypothetical protein
MAVTAGEIVYDRRQVLVPIYEQVKKFIQPCQDRRDGEAESQNLKRLIVVLIFGRAWRNGA